MNAPPLLAKMPTQNVLLCLFAVERELDRLATRRTEVMAELSTRLTTAKGKAQPETPTETP